MTARLGTAGTGTLVERELIAAIALQLGSRREAAWIVECGGTERAQALADRRSSGEPLQYVLGSWPFRSVELDVDPNVLIPRPETEQVVEVALSELERVLIGRDPDQGAGVVADLGTGSGAIALSLALEAGARHPGLTVWAVDDSEGALVVAEANRARLRTMDPAAAARVELRRGSWFGGLPAEVVGTFDLVVSNPPYVSEQEYDHLDPVIRDWEPRRALVSGPGVSGAPGMADIETVVTGAKRWLHRSGSLVVELAPSQAGEAVDVALRVGFGWAEVALDLAGRPRTLVARR